MSLSFWFNLVLTVLIVLGVTININEIGQPRKPLEAGTVAIITVLQGFIIWGLWAL